MARQRKDRKIKKLKRQIMIYCEGETERYYFEMLKRKYSANHVKITVKVLSGQSIALVKNAVDEINKTKHKGDIEQVYVVYDKDDESRVDIERALKLAKDNHIITLYSNECFEYWLLLHLKKDSGYHDRKGLYKLLEKELGLSSTYHNLKGEAVAKRFEDYIKNAYENAMALDLTEPVHENINTNPYTNIHHHIKSIFNTEKL